MTLIFKTFIGEMGVGPTVKDGRRNTRVHVYVLQKWRWNRGQGEGEAEIKFGMKKTGRTHGLAEPGKRNPHPAVGTCSGKLVYSTFSSTGPVISGTDTSGRRLKRSDYNKERFQTSV